MATRTWVGGGSPNNNAFAQANNWAENSIPVSGDDLVFDGDGATTQYDLTANLDQSAKYFGTITITPRFTARIGTAGAYLQVGSGSGSQIVNIGQPDAGGLGNGSPRIKLDFGSTSTEVNVYSTSTSATESTLPPVRLIGSSISALNNMGGLAGVAVESGETATVSAVRHSKIEGGKSPRTTLGSGCSLTNVEGSSGKAVTNSAITSAELTGDMHLVHNGAGGITTLRINSTTARCDYNSDGNLTNVYWRGILNFRGDARTKQVATVCRCFGGATLYADNASPSNVTFTPNITIAYPYTHADVTLIGHGFTVVTESS